VCFLAYNFDSIDREGPHQRAVRWLVPPLTSQGFEIDAGGIQQLRPERNQADAFSRARLVPLGKTNVRGAMRPLRRYFARRRPAVCIGLIGG
jgi:hypothetical protein